MQTNRFLITLMLMVFIISCDSNKQVSKGENAEAMLSDHTWVLKSWQTNDVIRKTSTQSIIHVTFDDTKMQLTGVDGCNNFFGSYNIDDFKLIVENLGGTKKYCGDDSAVDEQAFLRLLQEKPEIYIHENKLSLKTKSDIVIFNPQN